MNKKLAAKEKAIKVIESCKNSTHYLAALRYIEFFSMRFNDDVIYSELFKTLMNKFITISTTQK